jgi:hypothetical protein
MKPHRLMMLLVLALGWTAAVGEASTARADDACQATNAVFYSQDTVNLATALGAVASPCADYWISITPTAAGLPRDQAPLTTIHGLGSRFHAMAELRPKQWTTYAAANGWYATGVMLHDAMVSVGYEPTRDTWAVNEVGTPSDSTVNTDVYAGADRARQNFRDFVRGLYTGSSGPPMAGLVFAADPPQMTSNIWQYEQGLASWYSDAPFWQDMQQYVRFWAQETYADVRSWGVEGASLTQRASYLNDYYLHGSRLAISSGDATAAARAFFASAYTPIGNAAYRWPAPQDGGIGFGSTDVPLTDMLSFVSTQTYALRTSTPAQFGFAISAKNSNVTWNAAIYARMASSIRDSQDDPLGACTAAGESCDGVVAGAAFPETWREFATPPLIVPEVEGTLGAAGWYVGDVTVSWTVSDVQTPVTSPRCETTVISADTTGTTLTCTGMSSGGTSSDSVAIRRDATPPTISCDPTPASLWPPNGKLIPVGVAVDISDATSGPAGFELMGTSTSVGDATADIVGFDLEKPDRAGLLRAERRGTVSEREYALAYTASDVAGNSTQCVATVVVPHDRGDDQG